MIFDGLAKIGTSYKGVDYPVGKYIEEMEKNGIDRAVLIPQKPLSYVSDALAAHPDSAVKFVRVRGERVRDRPVSFHHRI